jgi:hypothetical protein
MLKLSVRQSAKLDLLILDPWLSWTQSRKSLTSWRNSFFEELEANAGTAIAAIVLDINIVAAAAAIAAIVVSSFVVVLIISWTFLNRNLLKIIA